jgi:hypothetical protein
MRASHLVDVEVKQMLRRKVPIFFAHTLRAKEVITDTSCVRCQIPVKKTEMTVREHERSLQ